MSSESKSIDCTNYDHCPKGGNVKVDPIKKDNENSLNVVMVGCWGVYGWDKEIDIKEYSLEKFIEKGLGKERKDQYEKFAKSIKKSDTIGEVKDDNNDIKGLLISLQEEYKVADDKKKEEIINKLFKDTKEVYGQIKVIEGIKKLDIDALFLAGDNVYSYNKPKDGLIKLITSVLNGSEKDIGLLPTKKGYKKNSEYSPQQIKEQLSNGFTKLVQGIPVKTNIFLGIGNHDIQTCEDLNEQLNHKKTDSRYGLHGLYYNVVYEMKDYKVNFIIIDTNMFSEDFHCDGKTKYTENQKNTQITWVIDCLKSNNSCKFNIIIGHCPYIANPHKNETVKNRGEEVDVIGIRNDKLEVLFEKIKETKDIPKVQVYMCADEHNQQFLYDNQYKMGLVVAGSGGTALDYDLSREQKIKDVDSKFRAATFGFVQFNFTDDEIAITYHNSQINDQVHYFVKLNENGEINYREE